MRCRRAALLAGIMLVLATGCSKQPAEEINTARNAVDSAAGEGSEKYAPADARRLNAEMAAALNEVKAQEAKVVGDYGKAREMLSRVKADAEAVRSSLPAKKEEARRKAVASVENAVVAVEETKRLAKMSAGEHVEPVDDDIRGLEDALSDIRRFMDQEDYLAAAEKASSLRLKAAEIARTVRQTAEKKPG